MNVRYKDYLIETLETSPSGWRARVRRVDGQKIKILTDADGKEVESITTSGRGSFSVDDVVALAKEMIDGGDMR